MEHLSSLRHQSMQANTKYAAQLLQEQWSNMEDISGARLPLCIASKKAPSRVTPRPLHPNASVHPILSPLPLNQKWDSSTLSPVVNSDQLCLHAVSLSLSDVVCPPSPCLGTALRKNHPGTLPTLLLIPTELFCGALIFLVLSG